MSYQYSLPADTYDGEIHGIRIRWSTPATATLQNNAGLTGVSIYTLKAVTENFVYLLAHRLQHTDAVIKGSPHNTTTNSATQITTYDDVHITAQVQGGTGGSRKKVHIYLDGVQDGPNGYDYVDVKGETVFDRRGHEVADLSRDYSGGQGGSAYGSATSGASAWGAGYSTGGGSGQESTSGESPWVWSEQYQRYYNSVTREWAEPQQ